MTVKLTKLSKAEWAELRAEWRKAVAEGRVLRYGEGASFKSFPTVEALQEELARLEPGLATIVKEEVL